MPSGLCTLSSRRCAERKSNLKYAVIDIGSNSVRLSVYDVNPRSFRILFREKQMVGLAGYVDNGRLNYEGITCACESLLQFKKTLELLEIASVSVFATASLRNIDNTEQAVSAIEAAAGFQVEIVSGEEEALYGFAGAMGEFSLSEGLFADIGGASTELAAFSNGRLLEVQSYPVGSLQLFRQCVKKILPGLGGLARIENCMETVMNGQSLVNATPGERIVCVGGTARAALKLSKRVFGLKSDCRTISALQLETLCEALCRADKAAIDLILKAAPERIHTVIPGVLILRKLTRDYQAAEVLVSQYGVREGYLCRRIQPAL